MSSRGLVQSNRDSFLEAMSDANMFGQARPWLVALNGSRLVEPAGPSPRRR